MEFAEEGMLIPSLIKAFYSDMKAEGMKLTPDQIYSINSSSIKDAIIRFNTSCTAGIISTNGINGAGLKKCIPMILSDL